MHPQSTRRRGPERAGASAVTGYASALTNIYRISGTWVVMCTQPTGCRHKSHWLTTWAEASTHWVLHWDLFHAIAHFVVLARGIEQPRVSA